MQSKDPYFTCWILSAMRKVTLINLYGIRCIFLFPGDFNMTKYLHTKELCLYCCHGKMTPHHLYLYMVLNITLHLVDILPIILHTNNLAISKYCVCSMNCFVDRVLMTGFRQEFRGKRINANIDSREAGTYVVTASRDRIVTVIEARKFVRVTIPSRTKICNVFICDCDIIPD